MKIVIAPDSFKESLTAQQVCQAIAKGVQQVLPEAQLVLVPMADGGEGSVQSLVDATQGRIVSVNVLGPQANMVEACYGILGDQQTAVIEMAAASGLHHVPIAHRCAKSTTSYGTGELIRHALDQGVTRLILGLGGSATNDAGVGMLAALGAKFLKADGHSIALTGAGLLELADIDVSELDPRLLSVDIQVACDVNNPLCGEQGAAAVFAPQKGANLDDVQLLDQALARFAQITEQVTGKSVLHPPGAGAAGGMGAAMLGFTSATLRSGVEIVLETVQLAKELTDADLVITGEGKIDSQTQHGKTPMGVALLAKRFALPVIALAGCTGEGYEVVYEHGIDAVFSAVPRAMALSDALTEAQTNLTHLAENVMRLWLLNH